MGAVQLLVDQPGSDRNPKYAPDGQHIAFVTDGGQSEPIGLGDLNLIKAKGGKLIQLPHTPDRSAGLMGWTADGKNLVFSEAHHTSRTAMLLPIADVLAGEKGTGKAKVLCPAQGTSGATDYDPKTGKMALVYQTPDQPAELYIGSMDSKEIKAITKHHADIELPKMGKTEVITWKSKDGMLIEGLLTYPVDYEPGKKYPGILQIHGGPGGVFTQGFTGAPSIYLTQYFAEQGFFILRPNPRGSTGYGKEFRYANFMDWGFGDYEDLMTGMDKLIEEGKVNEEKTSSNGVELWWLYDQLPSHPYESIQSCKYGCRTP